MAELNFAVTIHVHPPSWTLDLSSATPLVEACALMTRFRCFAKSYEHGLRLFPIMGDTPAPSAADVVEFLSTPDALTPVRPMHWTSNPTREEPWIKHFIGLDLASGPDKTIYFVPVSEPASAGRDPIDAARRAFPHQDWDNGGRDK